MFLGVLFKILHYCTVVCLCPVSAHLRLYCVSFRICTLLVCLFYGEGRYTVSEKNGRLSKLL